MAKVTFTIHKAGKHQRHSRRNQILDAAQRCFKKQGFHKTTLRDIAQEFGMSAGHIYNYFSSKDEIFRTVVQPVTLAFEQMAHSHHDSGGTDVLEMYAEPYLRKVTDEYVTLINSHRRKLEILLFRAQGSSLEDFRERYTDRTTAAVKEWLAGMKRRHPALNIAVSDFSIHLHTVWMFTLFEEIIMHRVKPREMKQVIAEYIRFETTGWKELMKI